MRLALIIHSLQSGGAERVMSVLANAWARRGCAVSVFTFDDGTVPPHIPLAPNIVHRPLAITGYSYTPWHAAIQNLRRTRRLRAALSESKPDYIISFITETNIVTLLATFGMSVPVLVSERVDVGAHKLPLLWRALRWFSYRFARVVVVQGDSIAARLPKHLKSRARVIPNPVSVTLEPRKGHPLPPIFARQGRKKIVAMGRLTSQKGFDILIHAFARIASRFPEWDLIIWGEGSERGALEALVGELNLADRVTLPGTTTRPFRAMAAGHLFVLPSRYEGFPNVLAEAMACGRPIIAADCPGSVAELVRDGQNGILVPPDDVTALALAIEWIITDPALRRTLAKEALSVRSRYAINRIMNYWDDLLAEIGRAR